MVFGWFWFLAGGGGKVCGFVCFVLVKLQLNT